VRQIDDNLATLVAALDRAFVPEPIAAAHRDAPRLPKALRSCGMNEGRSRLLIAADDVDPEESAAGDQRPHFGRRACFARLVVRPDMNNNAEALRRRKTSRQPTA
jgi:hypothetical protein